jgi:hypothetical protein
MFLAVACIVVLLGGRAMPSSTAPEIVAGHVMAPLDPFVVKLARTATYNPNDGSISILRGSHDLRMRVRMRDAWFDGVHVLLPFPPYVRAEEVRVPLGAVARALGIGVTFDARTKTVVLDRATTPEPLATPPPYNAMDPNVAPTAIFTREPRTTPRPVEVGSPEPRRTPLETQPSWPVLPGS